ncbi:MAG: GNAT family N-acetyltransferase [Anaerolineae bacterium]|nr:GNAT family N-acetyltransferase [Anaerolineae bacterium]
MLAPIRHPRLDEFDALMRFLERCFGHSKGFFVRNLPHISRPDPEIADWSYVIEKDGQIVSHVGVYPIEVVTAGVRLKIGGIGGVSTCPEARGKGHMIRLLCHCIDEMRAQGYPLSWLGGDRQRYNGLGWERANPGYAPAWSRRSLDWLKVAPCEVEEQFPQDAIEHIRRLQDQQPCHVIRSRLALQLSHPRLRVWTAPDGYAIAEGEGSDRLSILELVSISAREVGMIRAMIDRATADSASWTMSAWDNRLPRLMPSTEGYRAEGWWMYRIVDLTKLLQAALPHLERRARAVRNFAVALGIREHDRVDVATIAVENGAVEVRVGKHAPDYIELDPLEAVRLLVGGPPIGAQVPAELHALLPIPVHVPPLDYV